MRLALVILNQVEFMANDFFFYSIRLTSIWWELQWVHACIVKYEIITFKCNQIASLDIKCAFCESVFPAGFNENRFNSTLFHNICWRTVHNDDIFINRILKISQATACVREHVHLCMRVCVCACVVKNCFVWSVPSSRWPSIMMTLIFYQVIDNCTTKSCFTLKIAITLNRDHSKWHHYKYRLKW